MFPKKIQITGFTAQQHKKLSTIKPFHCGCLMQNVAELESSTHIKTISFEDSCITEKLTSFVLMLKTFVYNLDNKDSTE